MDAMTSARVQPLREALEFLGATKTIPEPETLAQRAAAGALGRARSLLRAILALVETPGVEFTEIDVLVRVLMEMAITLAWIGKDEDRAVVYRDYGVEQAVKWMRSMEEHGAKFGPRVREPFDAYVAEGTGGTLPDLRKRASEPRAKGEPGQGWTSLEREYDFIYRRLCAAVHHDHRLQALILPMLGKDAVALTLNAAKVATGVLLSSAWEPLNMPAALGLGLNLLGSRQL